MESTAAVRTSDADLFALASAPMAELLEALAQALSAPGERSRSLPARSSQLVDLVIAEVVRLIRLGATSDLARDARRLSRATTGRRGTRLADADANVHRRLEAASIVLSAAAAPTSRGGELNVLRAWSGKARRLVAMVASAEGESLPRARCRKDLELSESAFSHLLADVEEAGLLVRVKQGRDVTLHLGTAARLPHVRELLDSVEIDRPEPRVPRPSPMPTPGTWRPGRRDVRPAQWLAEPEPEPEFAAAA